MGEDVHIAPSAEIERGPVRQEAEARRRQVRALLTLQHGVEHIADRVQVQDIGRRIIKLLGAQGICPPVRGLLFLGGSFLLGIGVLLFSLSTSFVVAILMLIVAGLGVSGFATMQTTITVTTAEPRMRGSAMGAVTLAIGLLPIGMFMIGLLTEWLGAPRAVTVSSLLGLGAILAITALQSSLRRA